MNPAHRRIAAATMVMLLFAFLASLSPGWRNVTVASPLSASAAFPSGYRQARQEFRAGCVRRHETYAGFCHSFHLRSPSDPDLTIDSAYFSAGHHDLLVLESGIHGPEGYAGSAIQQRLMQRWLQPLLEHGMDVYLVHALNPYGFRYGRRADEFNVNLNRNFSIDETLYRTQNAAYAALRSVLEPRHAVGRLWLARLRIFSAILRAYVAGGFDAQRIMDGMNSGQYQFPEGLNFGGRTHEEQTAFMARELAPLLVAHDGRILFLDVHTGLGASGRLNLLTGKSPSPPLLARARTVFGNTAGHGIALATTEQAGFYPTDGDVIDYVPQLALRPDRVLALTMEFGTTGTGLASELRDAATMILENQAHFHGCATKATCSRVRAAFVSMFNPDDPAWRATVLEQADIVLRKISEQF